MSNRTRITIDLTGVTVAPTAPAAPAARVPGNAVIAQTVLHFIRQRRAEFEQQIQFLQQLDQHEEEDEEKENANHSLYNFILDQSGIELRTDPVYSAIAACCENSDTGEMPTSRQIASKIMDQKNCACFINEDPSVISSAAEHALQHFSATDCSCIARILLFHIAEHRYPTPHELDQTYRQLTQVMDPAQTERPASRVCPGLEKLKSCPVKKTLHQACCICQSDITRGSKMIKLNPCGHVFHDKTRDCDGVRPWLQENDTCPICIEKVEII